MDKKEATKELAKIVSEAKKHREKSLKKAVALADKHGLTFVWDDTYGSRQQEYLGKGSVDQEYDYDTDEDKEVVLEEGKWTSSSEGC